MAARKKPKSVLIVPHLGMPEAVSEAGQVAAWLQEKGLQVATGQVHDPATIRRVRQGEFDLVVALGGDGTMLRAGHLCAPSNVPILGINLGRFGFLMEISRHEWVDKLPLLIAGKYRLEKRMMLRAELFRGGEALGSWHVLNEVVVCRGQIVRPIQITTCLDNSFLTTYVADGLIVSTPTGSTAYALAVGGPILPPDLRSILIVPVAPHLSVDRAVVVDEHAVVNLTVHTQHQAVLSADGQAPIQVLEGDTLQVQASDQSIYFVRFKDPSYFYNNLTSHMNQNPSIGATR